MLGDNFSKKAKGDFELIQRAIDKKDDSAYTELMSRYKDSIYFMLLKMVRNKDDAEDLTIEAFGKAFMNLDQYSPKYAFSTWLFRIASNNCIDFLRKKKMETTSIDQSFEDEGAPFIFLPSTGRNPEEDAIRNQKFKMMRELVAELKPQYKELIELRYFKGLSYDEISKELDLSLGTVKAQLFRARKTLEEVIKPKMDHI
ncbi:MAG: RNA polymerase sigma factor [Flavobacteriales bacterium]